MDTSLDFDRAEKRARTKKTASKVLVYTFLCVWGLIVLFPFYWMILTSFKGYGAYNAESIPKFFTLSPTLENYFTAFTSVPLLDYFVNTLIFTVLTTALMLVIIIPAAFAFARLEFKGKNLVFLLFLQYQLQHQQLESLKHHFLHLQLHKFVF